jgi:hypothetical protein
VNKNKTANDKFNRLETQLQNIDLDVINTIVEDPKFFNQDIHLILLIAEGDCGACINKGFELIAEINNRHNISTYVITSGLNSGYLQLTYSYEKYIYQDNNDLIRKKLQFCYTPILFAINKKNKVQKALVLNTKNLTRKKIKDFSYYFNKN